MSKRMIKNCSLLLLFVGYILFYKLFLFNNYRDYSSIMSATFMVVVLALYLKLLGWRKDKNTCLSKNSMNVIIIHVLVAFIGMYILGFFIGFLKNAYSLRILAIVDNIFAPILIIVCTEFLRYIVIWANRDKKLFIKIFTFMLCAFEIIISVKEFPMGNFEELFKLFTVTLLPVFIKNYVLSFVCYHAGYKGPLFYRLILDVYVFVIPVLPDLGDYFSSIILIALPILIYINVLNLVEEKEDKIINVIEKNSYSWIDIPISIIFILIACLVSGFFPHYMIGIGSQSMSPKINKGDAVILRKVSKDNHFKKGDVIAFRRGDKIVVHRIAEVTKNGGERVYVTKGDANNGVDSQVVYPRQVRGLLRVKVPFIAYPTVWLSEWISNNKKK